MQIHLNQNTDELLDLVDKNNDVIAIKKRSEVFAQGLKNFRVVLIRIKNKEGNYFIVRRSYDKPRYPGFLAHVGGLVQSGETYDQAFLRELYEETGIDATNMQYVLLVFLNPFEVNCDGYTAVYELLVDDCNIAFNQDDFADAYWMSLDHINRLMEDGSGLTPNFPLVHKYF